MNVCCTVSGLRDSGSGCVCVWKNSVVSVPVHYPLERPWHYSTYNRSLFWMNKKWIYVLAKWKYTTCEWKWIVVFGAALHAVTKLEHTAVHPPHKMHFLNTVVVVLTQIAAFAWQILAISMETWIGWPYQTNHRRSKSPDRRARANCFCPCIFAAMRKIGFDFCSLFFQQLVI